MTNGSVEFDSNPNEAADSLQTHPTPPLYESPRLKGYITLLSSSVYNYISARDQTLSLEDQPIDWCLAQYDLGILLEDPRPDMSRLRYAMAAAVITIMITSFVIFIHLVSITGLGNKLWSKLFGRESKAELYVSAFLTFLWIVTAWFNTTVRGPAGSGKEQYNLYFSTWICCFTSFWILESWSTSTGSASFQSFVLSWPNRCPMWIVTFILSFTDFCFVLDLERNWKEGLQGYPYMLKYFSGVHQSEWVLLVFVTAVTFASSLGWILAEIFRENKINTSNTKSDQENHVEGIVIHILTLIWIPTVFIVTVPGGASSLIGNTYFTTWSCTFSVVGTLIWWQRTWREGIFDKIEEQQNEYDKAKRAIQRREEKRLANLEEQNKHNVEDDLDDEEWVEETSRWQDMEGEPESFDDVDMNSNEDIANVDKDDDGSIASTELQGLPFGRLSARR